MKKLFLFAIASLLVTSCQNDDSSTDSSFKMKAAGADYTTACSLPVTVVSGNITTNTTWTNDRVWAISGVLRVKDGAKLTIQAGTFIKGVPLVGGGATGVLVITKTGQIDAQGTLAAPVVFTSYKLLDCDASTVAAPGDFGGVVLLGDAPTNTGVFTNVIEGLGDQSELSDFYYGGTNSAHDAGDLNYVRIEYAGRILNEVTGVEINGLTFGGVGNGTVVDHIQVSYGRDDSYEWFGGTVNASHLVSFAPDDDNFDFDNGYTGSITKAIAIADQNSTHSVSGTSPDSNGIELDNNAGGTVTTLITKPVISQLSIIGVSTVGSASATPRTGASAYENAIHVRRAGEINLSSATVTGYVTGIRWEAPSLSTNSTWGALSIQAYTDPVLPAIGLGFGSSTSIATSGSTWNWGFTQPFFNVAGFSPSAGATTGAFATEPNWTNTWTKFSGF